MKKASKFFMLTVLAVVLLTGNAFAGYTTVLPGTATPLENLGGVLDQLYGWSNVLRIDDNFDQVWVNTSGSASAQWKSAWYAQNFGILTDTDSNGYYETLTTLFTVTSNGPVGGPTASLPAGSYKFLFADDITQTPPNLWTSVLAQNTDLTDHMVTYLITGGTSLGNYVIGFEDVTTGNPYFGADWDYNDLVVEIAGANPVPEPATMLLVGSGFLGLIGLGRKRFHTAA